MKNLYLSVIFLSFICLVNSDSKKENKFAIKDDDKFTEQLTSVNCETMIIFDLSKNIIKKEIFDTSIKIFLKFIVEYCNAFKYVIIDKNFNGCKDSADCSIQINACNALNGCEKIIDNLDYTILTTNYSTELQDANSNISFTRFLAQAFGGISPCKQNSVILLTNRILFVELYSPLTKKINDSHIKFSAVLLGRFESNTSELISSAYNNIQNARTLSFPNYDCLSYLFYCLIPCKNETLKCIDTDISDCQYPSKITPNIDPRRTLHVWYVFHFIYPIDKNTLRTYFRTLHDGLERYTLGENITKIRVKAVLSYDIITESYEDLYSTLHYVIGAYNGSTGSVVDDGNRLNLELGLIPWSGTLVETRIGILVVIILTNYATTDLKTVNDGETLQGQMFINNPDSYKYYSKKLKNDTNFHFYTLNLEDPINFYPIQTRSSTPSTTTAYTLPSSTVQYKQTAHSKRTVVVWIICGIILIMLVILFIGYLICRRKKQWKQRQEKINSENQIRSKHINDEWELTWDKLDIKDEIGSGAFGQIMLGKLCTDDQTKEDGVEVAIKLPGKLVTEAEKNQFLNEINLMKNIAGNENIIKMLGCIMNGNRICLVTEFCSNSDLLKYVKKLKSDAIAEEKIKKEFVNFFRQISNGLQFIAEKGIVHRDLAARNILIDCNKNAKITDFGLFIQLRDKSYVIPPRIREKLPIKWLAIESLKMYKFSLKTDIWTFAVVLYEMYSFGETPYENVEAEELLKYLEKGNRLSKPDFCSYEIFEIMLQCWMENPFRRPSMDEIIKQFTLALKSSPSEYEYSNMLKFSTGKTKDDIEQPS